MSRSSIQDPEAQPILHVPQLVSNPQKSTDWFKIFFIISESMVTVADIDSTLFTLSFPSQKGNLDYARINSWDDYFELGVYGFITLALTAYNAITTAVYQCKDREERDDLPQHSQSIIAVSLSPSVLKRDSSGSKSPKTTISVASDDEENEVSGKDQLPNVLASDQSIEEKKRKADRAEKAFLSASTLLIIFSNFTSISQTFGTYDQWQHGSNRSYAEFNLCNTLIISGSSLLMSGIDFAFEATNVNYDSCKEIRTKITDSDNDLLVQRMFARFGSQKSLQWLINLGTLSHVFSHALDNFNVFQPRLFSSSEETAFAVIFGLYMSWNVPINLWATYYYDGANTKDNMQPEFSRNSKSGLDEKNSEKNPTRSGYLFFRYVNFNLKYGQPIYHALPSAVKVYRFAFYLLENSGASKEATVALTIMASTFVFVMSGLGNYHYEAKQAAKKHREAHPEFDDFKFSCPKFGG